MAEARDNKFNKPDKENVSGEIYETQIETPEQILEIANDAESAIEAEKNKFVQEGEAAIGAAVESLGGRKNDTEEGTESLQPIKAEMKKAADEAQIEIELAALELLAQKWSAAAKEAIKAAGYRPDPDMPPHKDYSAKLRERFHIQRCTDRDGNGVVVKVSSSMEKSRKELKNEGLRYAFLERMKAESTESLEISFCQKIEEFEYGGQNGLVTRYMEDDMETKNNLSVEGKVRLISKVIREMLKLPIPEEELKKPHKKKLIEVMSASEYKWQLQESIIPDLLEAGIISEDMARRISETMEDSENIIASFPLRLDHGDLHGGNIFYSVDKNGQEKITLIDLEGLKITNEFSSLAHIALREELLKNVRAYRKRADVFEMFGPLIETQLKLLDNNGELTKKLEEEFVFSHERPKDASRVYRMMRIYEILRALQGTIKLKREYALAMREIYQGMLYEQMRLPE